MSFGREFRMKEKMRLTIRAEFSNIFNRTEPGNPSGLTYTATPSKDAQGRQTAGFGFMNYTTPFSDPRTGQLVGRFQF